MTEDTLLRRNGESADVSLLGDEDEEQPSSVSLWEDIKNTIVQENGQRKFGGPPPGWEGPPPPRGCEVFVGKIPRNVYEDRLVPLFERVGRIYEFRLMMEFSGENRGYAFVMYTNREAAHRAIQLLDNYEICPGKCIGVCVSLDNCRLFVSSIPKDKKKEEIMEEMKKLTDGVSDVIVYPSPTDKSKNRGFAFVEYKSHKAAAMARRKLIPGSLQLWGHTVQVDWAEPEKDVDQDAMQHVRVLYVRNLMPSTSEETLRLEFSRFKPGCVERVKKLTDYAFIHYRCRDDAITALSAMNGAQIDGALAEVTLAKPVGVRDGGGVGRRYHNRVHLQNGGAGNAVLPVHSNGGGTLGGAADTWSPVRARTLPARLGSPLYLTAKGDDQDGRVFPLVPSAPLSPTSLLSLSQSQISSAVSLLDLFCRQQGWSQPEYHLFSTPGQGQQLLLLYKVVIPATRSIYIPDKLCVLLDDAKELAAQTTLQNLDPTVRNRVYCGSQSSSSSPLAHLSPPTCPSRLRPPAPAFPFPFSPVSPISPVSSLSSLSPPASQTHRLYISSQSPVY